VVDITRAELRSWLSQLTTEPIDPYREGGEARYVALEDSGRDAVDSVFSRISLAVDATTQLLSGPEGSGKTTELYRLQGMLRGEGHTVVLVQISDYVNQSSEIDVTEFIIALGLACGRHLGDPGAGGQESFVRRLWGFLQRVGVSLDLGPFRGEISADRARAAVAGVSLEVDLQRELKSSKPFVEELREKLSFQVGALYEEVADYIGGLVAADRARRPESAGVVVIVDSLEKLRGTIANDDSVQASVQALFVHHSSKLRFATHHMVYTVPPFLLFTDPGMLPYDGTVRAVPVPPVRSRLGERDAKAQRIRANLVSAVSRRIPWESLLEEEAALDRIISASGGHLRDLFKILQELITLAHAQRLTFPVGTDTAEEAIIRVGRGFSNITNEDAQFMRLIHRRRGLVEPRESEVHRLARLMNTHMVLAHLNHENWYEVHPLACRTLGLE
jgi:energy-coupling factor transporter ATP-binding protein EcfA2